MSHETLIKYLENDIYNVSVGICLDLNIPYKMQCNLEILCVNKLISFFCHIANSLKLPNFNQIISASPQT